MQMLKMHIPVYFQRETIQATVLHTLFYYKRAVIKQTEQFPTAAIHTVLSGYNLTSSTARRDVRDT